MMNYQEAENYILSFANLPRREYMAARSHCSIYLERLQYFLDLAGNPEKRISHYVHVTGTSGKGSVIAFIRSILLASGEKVGSITSPHPSFMHERWWVDNRLMTKREFVEVVLELKPVIDKYLSDGRYEMISFFELSEAIGLYYLAKKKVNWAVLEVGCGGRYDSSNVIPYKDIAVITNIGLDHTAILGKTKEKIAIEKAGIIKKNSSVFTAERNNVCLKIIKDECIKTKTKLNIINNPKYNILSSNMSGIDFDYKNNVYKIQLLGNHQVKNAILAIEISEALGVDRKRIKIGLKKAFHPLSMEMISLSPLVILDGAHNKDKIESTIQSIKQIFGNKKLDLVVGFSENKNISNMVEQLSGLNLNKVAVTRNTVNHLRKVAEPIKIVKEFKIKNKKIKTKIFSEPQDAFDWIMKSNPKNLKLVTGSIFLSGEIRKNIKK